MKPSGRMVYLTTVVGSFHGHVLAARLGAEGIPVELRGMSEGPYPLLANVNVFVHEDELETARILLLGDAVDAAFDVGYGELGPEDAGALDLPPVDPPRPGHARRARRILILAVVGLVLIACVVASFY